MKQMQIVILLGEEQYCENCKTEHFLSGHIAKLDIKLPEGMTDRAKAEMLQAFDGAIDQLRECARQSMN